MEGTPIRESVRIDTLDVQHYRCFDEASIPLHRHMTMFLARNGTGKSAVLEATAAAMSAFTRWFPELLATDRPGIPSDAPRITYPRGPLGEPFHNLPARVSAHGGIGGSDATWSVTRANTSGGTKYTAARAPQRYVERLVAEVRDGSPEVALPILAAYPTSRTGKEAYRTRRMRHGRPSRISAYARALSSVSSSRLFLDWFFNESMARDKDLLKEVPTLDPEGLLLDRWAALEAVEHAINVVLEPAGVAGLHYSDDLQTLAVTHALHGPLPVTSMSDGIRTMVGLVGDLAHRCARLNPWLGLDCCSAATGVVTIDEIDLHLHPEWQQHVAPSLMRAFPNLQFVCSTHSPLVATTLERDMVRVIEPGGAFGAAHRVMQAPVETHGARGAVILEDLQLVDDRPPDFRKTIAELARRIETDPDDPAIDAIMSRLAPLRLHDDELEHLDRVRRLTRPDPGRGGGSVA